MIDLPPNAPYTITLGEPIEVRVFDERDDESNDIKLIVGEVEYQGDKFGLSIDPHDLGSAPLEVAVDEMVEALARYVWHELGGTPIFREEEAGYTGRVDVRSAWTTEPRIPTRGLIANPEVVGTAAEIETVDEPVLVADEEPERDAPVSASGALDEDDMLALLTGDVPDAIREKLMRQVTPSGLLDVLQQRVTDDPLSTQVVRELRRRLA